MLQFKRLEAQYLSLYTVQVTWRFHPSPEPVSGYVARVYYGRSQEPEDMEPVSGNIIGVTAYIHTLDAPSQEYKRYCYRIRLSSIADPATVTWSDPVIAEHPPDLITAELINKQELVLRVKNGKHCALYIRMIHGVRCARCWDEYTLTRNDGDCRECIGTGFTGGYYPPVYKYVNINQDMKSFTDSGDGGKDDDVQAIALLAPFPRLTSRDIIVERNNGIVWRVVREMSNVRKYRYQTKQIWGLVREPEASIESRMLGFNEIDK